MNTLTGCDTGAAAQALHDRRLIEELVYRWAGARDSDDWAALAACFHADAQIHISWISAPADAFVNRSRAMATGRKPGGHMKHLMSAPWIEVNGRRGFSRSNATLLIRDCIDGVWFDIESQIRFFDRVELRDGVWRIVERIGVYDKDRVDSVGGAPSADVPWHVPALADYPPAARFLCWWLASKGLAHLPDLIAVYSEEETRLRDACRAWAGLPTGG